MASHLKTLKALGLLSQAPAFVFEQIQYEAMTGSVSYGVSQDTSDIDLVGFCIPPKQMVFPHLAGEIDGFGTQYPRFNQFQRHHIKVPDGKEYDVTVYGIVRYFKLLMDNNPNIIDSLFVPVNCVLYSSPIAQMVRESRHLFLSKKVWHSFKGYAYNQLHKLNNNARSKVVSFEKEHHINSDVTLSAVNDLGLNPDLQHRYKALLRATNDPEKTSKRWKYYYQFGYDTKFSYNIVRLLGEVEQLLTTGTMDLRADSTRLKAIRAGAWELNKFNEFFQQKELTLEQAYETSSLPYAPDENAIKTLLLNCLEEHFGSLDEVVQKPQNNLLTELQDIVNKYTP